MQSWLRLLFDHGGGFDGADGGLGVGLGGFGEGVDVCEGCVLWSQRYIVTLHTYFI